MPPVSSNPYALTNSQPRSNSGNLGFSSSPTQSNPYINQQAQAIGDNVYGNLQNSTLPGINSGAQAAGGYGGSRQGIAQGLAIQGANRDVANAQSSLYANAYNTDQANNSQMQIAGMNNQTQRYATDASTGLGYAGLQNQANIANQSNQLGYAGLQNQSNIANQSNQTAQQGQNLNYQVGMAGANNQRYATDANTSLGYAGLQNQAGIAGMQDATNRYNTNTNANLGYAGLQNQANIATPVSYTHLRAHET
jgi:hypothetical protein